MRILVLEANVRLFTEHTLRFMQLILPMDQVEIVHAANLEAAAGHLETGTFDYVIYDYQLGKPIQKVGMDHTGQEIPVVIRSGVDLFRFRKSAEERGLVPPSVAILFTSTTLAARQFFTPTTANPPRYSKLDAHGLAQFLKARLPKNTQPEVKKEDPLAQQA